MNGIQLQSNLKLNFEQMGIQFQSILNDYSGQFAKITRQALLDFDFEKAIKNHVNNCIKDGLQKAFSKIDLSERVQKIIWNEIEKRMETIKEGKDDNKGDVMIQEGE